MAPARWDGRAARAPERGTAFALHPNVLQTLNRRRIRRARAAAPIVEDSIKAARDAHLRYVSDDSPGIARRRRGKSFDYFDAGGKQIHDPDTINRIRHLAIPPAWTDVWICPHDNGHIQAVGRDARGRKQYRYHPRWREVRDATKYDRMIDFAKALPLIRRKTAQHLK